MLDHNLIFFIIITISVVLIFFGLSSTPKFCSWHMFADLHMMQFTLHQELADGTLISFNPWDVLPHTHLSMSLTELKFFLQYLALIKKIKVHGTVVVYFKNEVTHLEIRGNHVLDI